MKRLYDAIVVGNGIVGKFIARFLLDIGFRVLIIEKENMRPSSLSNQGVAQFGSHQVGSLEVASMMKVAMADLEVEFSIPRGEMGFSILAVNNKEAAETIAAHNAGLLEKFKIKNSIYTDLSLVESKISTHLLDSCGGSYFVPVAEYPMNVEKLMRQLDASIKRFYGKVTFHTSTSGAKLREDDNNLYITSDGRNFKAKYIFLACNTGLRTVLAGSPIDFPIEFVESLLMKTPDFLPEMEVSYFAKVDVRDYDHKVKSMFSIARHEVGPGENCLIIGNTFSTKSEFETSLIEDSLHQLKRSIDGCGDFLRNKLMEYYLEEKNFISCTMAQSKGLKTTPRPTVHVDPNFPNIGIGLTSRWSMAYLVASRLVASVIPEKEFNPQILTLEDLEGIDLEQRMWFQEKNKQ